MVYAQQLDNKASCWENASEEAKGMVRDLLLQQLGKADETRLIRRTVAEAIGSLAIKALPSSTLLAAAILIWHFVVFLPSLSFCRTVWLSFSHGAYWFVATNALLVSFSLTW
jgi:hypothetical protein